MARGRGTIWEWLTAVAGLVLIISQLMSWWLTNEEHYTAASKLPIVGKLLFLVGLAALLAPLIASLRQTPGRVQSYSVFLLVIGVLSTAYIAWKLSSPPKLDNLGAPVSIDPGGWVGLASAAAIAVFSLLGMRSRQAQRPATSGA